MAIPDGYTPEVNENKDLYPNFDYKKLDPAPPEYELYDMPDRTIERGRKMHLNKLKRLVFYHSWGMNVPDERKTKSWCLKVLKTISYNQNPNLRPTWDDFYNMTSDTGPRLLRPKYKAFQISRFYPHGMDGNPRKLLQDDGGAQAATDIPMFASNAVNMPPQSGQGQLTLGQRAQLATGGLMATSYDNAHTPLQSETGLQYCEHQDTTEAIERALIQFIYRDLERHPLAFETTTNYLNISTGIAADSLQIVRDEASASSDLRLRPIPGPSISFQLDPKGMLYPYRGRGPIWKNNSCSIDSIIIAGKFLEAGSTIADRGDDVNWSLSLTPVEYAYMEATSVNWDTIPPEVSTYRRDIFLKMVLSNFKSAGLFKPVTQHQNGIPIPIGAVWEACTKSFHQFRVTYSDTMLACRCSGPEPGQPTTRTNFTSSIAPIFQDDEDLDVDMATLMTRHFQHDYQATCMECGTAGGVQRKFGDLPWRLAVQPDQRVILKNHTNDIVINYTNLEGIQQTATYRWLGGIYNMSDGATNNYRVLWDDHQRGEESDGSIRMYDSKKCSGAIIGKILSTPEERVPSRWLVEGPPPLLFYEKVVAPRTYSLFGAQAAVENMLKATNNNHDLVDLVVRERGWANSNNSEGKPLKPKFILNRFPRTGQSSGYVTGERNPPASRHSTLSSTQQNSSGSRQTPRQVGARPSPAHNHLQIPARNVMPASSPGPHSSSLSTPRRTQNPISAPPTAGSINSMTAGASTFTKQPVGALQNSPSLQSLQGYPNQHTNIAPQRRVPQRQQSASKPQPQALTLGQRPNNSNFKTQPLSSGGRKQYLGKDTTRQDGMQQQLQSAEIATGLDFESLFSDINNRVDSQLEHSSHYAPVQDAPSVSGPETNALGPSQLQFYQAPDESAADLTLAFDQSAKDFPEILIDLPDPTAPPSSDNQGQAVPQDTNAIMADSLPWQQILDDLRGEKPACEQMQRQGQNGVSSTIPTTAGQPQISNPANAGQQSVSQNLQAEADSTIQQDNAPLCSHPQEDYETFADDVFDFNTTSYSPDEFTTWFEQTLAPQDSYAAPSVQAQREQEMVRQQQPGVPARYYTEGPPPIASSAQTTKRKRAWNQVDGESDIEGSRKKMRN